MISLTTLTKHILRRFLEGAEVDLERSALSSACMMQGQGRAWMGGGRSLTVHKLAKSFPHHLDYLGVDVGKLLLIK